MILCEEIYFEITLKGEREEVKKFARFLKSGELDEFFEVSSDFISYADDDGTDSLTMVFSNDDLGIECDELDTEEFLDLFCKAARKLEISGHIYDINDDEFSFISDAGSSDYINARKVARFNDELDEAAYDEEIDEE